MEHSRRLRPAVAQAIEAGDVAAAATRRVADGNRDPDDTGPGAGSWVHRWRSRSPGSAVTPEQIERACEHVDEFVASVEIVNQHLTPDAQVDTSHDWTTRLRRSPGASAAVHNEVTATLADLGRLRTDIVLRRPPAEQDHDPGPDVSAAGESEPATSPRLSWTTVCIDCDDADRLAEFYCRLLGWQVTARDGRGWVQARDPDGGVGLNFQSEPGYRPPAWPEQRGEPAKMLHFEIMVDDVERGVAHALECGAAQAAWQPPDRDPARLRVMLAPAGHPSGLFSAGE